MKNTRRSFIRNSASLASLSLLGNTPSTVISPVKEYVQDGGLQFCLAHFYGMNKQRIELSKQMKVINAVSGISPGSIGLANVKPWENEAVTAMKD
jgi:mannonate dehydratase